MNITNKIIDLLKEEKLDILESIEILRDIESAFIECLKENFNEMDNNNNHIQQDNREDTRASHNARPMKSSSEGILADIQNQNKTKCGLSIKGRCTGNFSPLKCDGLDVPEECLHMLENKSENKDV